jgi:hypothetical protein
MMGPTAGQKVQIVASLMPFVLICRSAVQRDEFLKRISVMVGVDIEALREDMRARVGKGGKRLEVRKLAPLDPDRFLAWTWQQGDRAKGTHPLTVEDIAFELGEPVEVMRRQYVHIAALVRRNQRLGRQPWEGVR